MSAWRAAGLGCLLGSSSACFLAGYELAPRDADVPLGAGDAEVVQTSPSGAPDAGEALDASSTMAACLQGEWCSHTCGGEDQEPCEFTCKTGRLCEIHCEGPLGCTGVTCERGATCAMFCEDANAAGGCNAACEQGVTADGCSAEAQAWCGACVPLPTRLP